MPVINNTDTLLVRGKDGKFYPIAVIKGDPGRGVLSVIRTEGDGSPGSTDVYTITFTDGGTTQFTVYNGRNGGSDIPPEIIADIVKQYFEDNPIDPAEIGVVSADQGAENADKILGIGEDGKVIPVDKPQGDVKTVAGVEPDASGNVSLTASDVGAATKEQLNTLSGEVAKKQPAGNYATKEEIPAVPVKSVNGKTGAVKLTASDVGALPGVYYGSDEPSEEYDVWIDPNGNESEWLTAESIKTALGYTPADAEELGEAVADALRQAKESGEFDGEPGKPGEDYVLTDADKIEIAQIAVGLLPKYNGEVEDA